MSGLCLLACFALLFGMSRQDLKVDMYSKTKGMWVIQTKLINRKSCKIMKIFPQLLMVLQLEGTEVGNLYRKSAICNTVKVACVSQDMQICPFDQPHLKPHSNVLRIYKWEYTHCHCRPNECVHRAKNVSNCSPVDATDIRQFLYIIIFLSTHGK